MNNNKISTALALTLMLSLNFVMPVRASQIDDDKGWVGSWQTTISPIAGDPVQFPALPGLMTINEEKTLIETDGSQLVPAPAGALSSDQLFASGGHGVWREAGAQRFTIKFVQIVVHASDSTLFGTVTLQFTVKLSQDQKHFQGKGTFNFADVNGNSIFSGNEQISGEEITIP